MNNAEAISLRDWLAAEGWDDVFLDLDPARGIVAGERWERALNEAARRCEVVIFLVSRAWLASEWCRREFNLARRLNKRIFGMLIESIAIGDLPSEITDTWQLVDLSAGGDHRMFRVTLPNGREAHVTFSTSALARLKTGLMKAGLDARFFAWPPESKPDRPPYRGLKPLEAEDAGIFFGREAEVIGALDRLRGLSETPPPRLLVILAASGAGKSSFLRAGLWPRLKRDDRNFLPLPVIRPERAAISGDMGLVRCLEDAFKDAGAPRARADIRGAIERGAEPFRALLAELAATAMPPAITGETAKVPTLILSIDQGEELFLTEGGREAQISLSLLNDLLSGETPSAIGLITIRSDSYERLQTAPALETIPQQTVSLPPLAKGAYLDVIESPARRLADTPRALKIEPALSNALLSDIEAGGAKDALPLLAFTLERLYVEHGGDGTLSLADYNALGRVKGSIEAAVERALKAADANPAVPRDRDARLLLLRRGLIPWLAGIDPDTGSPRRRVARLSEIPAEARPLIDHLVDARLLSTDADRTGEITIEPSHEALLRQWGLLKGWLEEDFNALAALEGVKRAASEWASNAKAGPWLAHRGGRLEEAERVAAYEDLARILTSAERDYLATCRRIENDEVRRKRRTSRFITFGSVAAALTLLLVAVAAFKARNEAVETRNAALLNQSQLLAGLSEQQRLGHDEGTAALIALEALPDKANNDEIAQIRPLWLPAEGLLNRALELLHELSVLKGHKGVVYAVAFSPDGERILTGSWDQTVRLWDVRTGSELNRYVGHRAFVMSVAFSPDGTRIVTGSRDNTARLWDTKTAVELRQLLHDDAVYSVAFSPDGTRILTGSTDNTARLWDAKTGRELSQLKDDVGGGVASVAFSPDGTRIVTGSRDAAVRVWDANKGALLIKLDNLGSQAISVTFSPDGTRIMAGLKDATARIWDAVTGVELIKLKGHDFTVVSIAFSVDGTRIVTGSSDKTARVWNASTGQELSQLKGHVGEVYSVAFSPDGTRILTGSRDMTARLWGIKTPAQLSELEGHDDAVYSVAFSPDGARILTGSADATARIWDARTGAELRKFSGHSQSVKAVAFSPDGTRIVTGSSDKTARVWDANTRAELGRFVGHAEGLTSIAFSPDGRRILTGSRDKTARVWDANTGAELGRLQGHAGEIWSVAFSPDGKRIVTGSLDKTARVWDANTGVELAQIRGYFDPISSVVFSPDGTRIVTGSLDKTARVWDANTGAELSRPMAHSRAVLSVAFSPDGGRIITGSEDKTARLWDAKTGLELSQLQGHGDTVYSVAFSPDGTRIVTASRDKTSRLWDARAGQAPVDYAKTRLPRCLTLDQRRRQFYLPPEPPSWCIEMEKWPYHTQAWKDWLSAKRAGKNLPLPED